MYLFCCEFAGVTSEIRKVSTLEIDGNIQSKCAERGDKWALEFQGRLESCNELVAEEAVYHRLCHFRFMRGLSVLSDESARGRPPQQSAHISLR